MDNLSRLLVAVSVWPSQTFQTVPYHPQNGHIPRDGTTAPRLLLFDQTWQVATDYALLIMTDENQLVWEGPLGLSATCGRRAWMASLSRTAIALAIMTPRV